MRIAAAALLMALLAVARPAVAVSSTPLSASPFAPGRTAVAGFVGFPYLSVEASHGFADDFDASLLARSAWSNIQRVGLRGRYRFAGGPTSAFALRATIDGWLARPTSEKWLSITGQQDFTGELAFLYSWVTSRGTVMTLNLGYDLLGNRHPPAEPLQGLPPAIAFGSNLAFRLAAEIPHESGVFLAFDLGMDFHLSGFDAAVAMPAFSVGVGYAL